MEQELRRLEGGETNQDILHEKNVFNKRKMIFLLGVLRQ